ncbi:MAG: serine/threonine protein kinase [Planctomycetes bacterium]|nr:serine/threonine protein kinase [Planctomycetota bacterium]
MTALDALERGEPAAVEALLREHPEHASALKRRLALLQDIGVLDGGASARPPERLGDFQILEQLGAGGMGVVYRARELRLDREVALKVVRPERLFFEGTRERFKREVETVARLQHPGIVPVYSVGEEQGVPYFAMELVEGKTVEQVLATLHGRDVATLSGFDLAPDPARAGYLFEGSWEAACVRVIKQVAEAVEHAHQRGVIHRDIKPSNVMLTAGDASRAMVFDFGLAAASGNALGGGRLTHTGARLGTLSYMAPEQVRGDVNSIDVRTDVYALGVTLYQMLTLRPAFGGRSDADVIVAIERGETRAVRSMNASISWEAETVCATAMERDSARRYATAADFARDLGNVLEKRPIEAQRAGVGLRVRRWIERHPALTAAYVLAGLLVVGGPTLWAWKERQAGLAIRTQRDRAERNFAHAMEAVDQMLSRVGEVDLRFVPQMEPVRKALLEDAVRLLERFVEENADDLRARNELAKGQARLASLFEELGRYDDSARARAREIETYDALLAETPRDLGLAVARQLACVARASAYVNAEAVAVAGPLLDENALAIERLLAEHPANVELARAWINNNASIGKVLRISDKLEESRAVLLRGVERVERELAAHPEDRGVVESAHAAWNEYGYLVMEHFTEPDKVNDEAARALTRAVELTERLVRSAPDDGQRRTALAEARINLGGVWLRAGEFARASEFYVAARDDLVPFVERFPNTLSFKFMLATAHNQIGLAADWLRDLPVAEENYSKTLDLLREITRTASAPNLVHRLGLVAYNLSSVKRGLEKLDEAEALTLAAIEALTRAIARAPENQDIARDLSSAYSALCAVRCDKGDWRGAIENVEQIVATAPMESRNLWRAMLVWTRCIELVRADATLADAERATRIEEFAVHAVDDMRASFERGDPRAARDIETLSDPKPLHGTAAWKAFVEERRAAQAGGAK